VTGRTVVDAFINSGNKHRKDRDARGDYKLKTLETWNILL